MTLYRPVGLEELELISATGFRTFPPRSALQPILYAVLDESFAAQAAHDWNANDPESGFAGFVVRFTIDDAFAVRYAVHSVAARPFREVWIPAEDVAALNAHLVGPLQVVEEFYGRKFAGERLTPPGARAASGSEGVGGGVL